MKIRTNFLIIVICLAAICFAATRARVFGENNEANPPKPLSTPINLESPTQIKPRLFVLSIGINKYKAPQYKLRFARKDAETMKRDLIERAGGEEIYSEIKPIFLLLDEQATRANILAALSKLESEVASTDQLIITFSGYGMTRDNFMQHRGLELVETDLEFYLLPHDMDSTKMEETSISSKLLKVYLQRIRARNKLFIFDACQSAFGYESLAQTFSNQDRELVSENTLFIGVDTLSYDDDLREQGTLTAVVLDGLRGAADFDANGKISARELEAYIYQGSLPFAIKYKEGGFHPRTIFKGNDFNIGFSDGGLAEVKYEKLKPNELDAEVRRLSAKQKEFGNPTKEVWLNDLMQTKTAMEKEIGELEKRAEKLKELPSAEQKLLIAALLEKERIRRQLDHQISQKTKEFEARKMEIAKLETDIKVAKQLTAKRQNQEQTRSKPFEPNETKKADAPRDGQDYALFFANDVYNPQSSWEKLNNPFNDVQDISQELQKSYGFKKENIAVLRNLTRAQIREVIKRYRGFNGESDIYFSENEQYDIKNYRPTTFKPDDQLFIFFAGHGHAYEVGKDDKGQPKLNGILVGSDSPTFDEDELDKFIRLDDLLIGIDSIPNNHIMVVFDTCYAGQMWKPPIQIFKDKAGNNQPNENFAEIITKNSRFIGKSSGNFSALSENSFPKQITRDEYIRRYMGNRSRTIFTSGSKPVPDGFCEEYKEGICVKQSRNSPFAARFLKGLRKKEEEGYDVLLASDMGWVFRGMPQIVERGRLDPTLNDGDFLFVIPK